MRNHHQNSAIKLLLEEDPRCLCLQRRRGRSSGDYKPGLSRYLSGKQTIVLTLGTRGCFSFRGEAVHGLFHPEYFENRPQEPGYLTRKDG